MSVLDMLPNTTQVKCTIHYNYSLFCVVC
uniref:Uncharacterized protein n=1 Tax=Anguilla anguilla TaxID=7936 RepID=A0A0E9VQU1_ANGAN